MKLETSRQPFPPPVFLALVFLLPALIYPAATQAADAFSRVAQAIAAKRTLSFQAKQDIWMAAAKNSSGSAETHIVARVVQAGPRIRLQYSQPNEARGRVVIDDGHWVHQWEQPYSLILVDQSHEETPETQRRMLRLLRQNYSLALQGSARINGLWCDRVAIRPKPGHLGPTRLLWIERQRSAILRAAEYDTAGTQRYLSLYERFQYVRFVPRALFSLPPGMPIRCMGPQELPEQSFTAAFQAIHAPGRLPCWQPSGYALVSCSAICSPNNQRSAILRYGDGLKMLTVIEAPHVRNAGGTIGPQPEQADHAKREIQTPDLQITVLPDSTLPDSIAQNMVLAFDPQTESRLQRGMAQTFGESSLPLARRLRRQGWGYDTIVALCLSLHSHPMGMTRLRHNEVPFPPTQREPQARRWIFATLNHDEVSAF